MNDSYLSPNALILVAIIPSPEDLQVARVLGWYRIPIRTAPRILNVDFLAFYQPASFQTRKWMVEFLAPVLGHELTTRADLLRDEKDHPRADEEYFKVQLGNVQQLKHPISAGDWKRFTFLYTTGEYFRQARIMTDLTVAPAERRSLWKALRERGSLTSTYQTGSENLDSLPMGVLSALLGIPDN
ncbi:MAG: hypothetical protein E4H33_01240 [Anaerolineales bacterium]|nr:MAG: hypothetical protein E4H33_01240 [Anaerolineales bacterium]